MFDANFRPLHRQHRRLAIFEAEALPLISFGGDGVVGQLGDQTISITQKHAFFLRSCGHMVTDPQQLGLSCTWCQSVAEAAGIPNPDFAALCCRACTRRCSVGTCGRSLCPSHGKEHPSDSRCYCPQHFVELESQLHKAAFCERYGKLAWLGRSLVRAAFHLGET